MMQAFDIHRGIVAPLPRRDVDTDQIIPKQFLKSIERTGFGRYLFNDWRVAPDGTPDAGFVLNDRRYAGASILVAGPNFGCGSSREHAAWALDDFGFRAVIAPSFADIFRNNAIVNGLLPVVLSDAEVDEITARALATPGYAVTIDLPQQRVSDDRGLLATFELAPAARQRLLHGLDDIAAILQHEAGIAAYEHAQRSPRP